MNLIDINCNNNSKIMKVTISIISSCFGTFCSSQTKWTLPSITKTTTPFPTEQNITTPDEKRRWSVIQRTIARISAIWIDSMIIAFIVGIIVTSGLMNCSNYKQFHYSDAWVVGSGVVAVKAILIIENPGVLMYFVLLQRIVSIFVGSLCYSIVYSSTGTVQVVLIGIRLIETLFISCTDTTSSDTITEKNILETVHVIKKLTVYLYSVLFQDLKLFG